MAYDHELTLNNKTRTMVNITEAAVTSSLDIRKGQVILTSYFAEFTSAKIVEVSRAQANTYVVLE